MHWFILGAVDLPLRLPHCGSSKGERHRGALPPHCKFAQQQPERGLSLMGIGRSLVRCRGEWEGHNNKHMARGRERVPQNTSGCNRRGAALITGIRAEKVGAKTALFITSCSFFKNYSLLSEVSPSKRAAHLLCACEGGVRGNTSEPLNSKSREGASEGTRTLYVK